MGLKAPRFGWLLAVSAGTAAFDQAVKWGVAAGLAELERIALLPFLDLVRWHNKGAAFGFLSSASGWQNALFLVLGIGLVAYMGTLMRNAAATRHASWALGLALMAGGAIGNLIDRAARGYVLDYVLLHYRGWTYPAFNAADASITIGVLLVLWHLLRQRRSASST